MITCTISVVFFLLLKYNGPQNPIVILKAPRLRPKLLMGRADFADPPRNLKPSQRALYPLIKEYLKSQK